MPKNDLLKLKNILFVTDNKQLYDNIKIHSKLLSNNISEAYNKILNQCIIMKIILNSKMTIFLMKDLIFQNIQQFMTPQKFGKNCVIGRGVKIGKIVLLKITL